MSDELIFKISVIAVTLLTLFYSWLGVRQSVVDADHNQPTTHQESQLVQHTSEESR